MNAKLRRRKRELLDIPFELDVTMDEILEDLFHPHPWRSERASSGHVADFPAPAGAGDPAHDRRAA